MFKYSPDCSSTASVSASISCSSTFSHETDNILKNVLFFKKKITKIINKYTKPRESHIWCEYCNRPVTNTPKCIKIHNDSPLHLASKRKFEKSVKQQRVKKELDNNILKAQLEEIKNKSEKEYIKKDIMKINDDSLLNQYIENKTSHEQAKELYGEELYKIITSNDINRNKPKDKTELYNSIMASLPSSIPKQNRLQISRFE